MSKKPDALSLGPNERVIWSGNRAKRSFLSSAGKGLKLVIVLTFLFLITSGLLALETRYGFGELCFVHLLFLAGLVIFGPFIFQYKYEYAITNERVFARVGIGGRRINEIRLENIVNTTYNQGFIGRILNFGNLQFNSAAGASQGVVFKGVKDVKSLNQKVKNILASELNLDQSPRVQQNINIKADRYSYQPPQQSQSMNPPSPPSNENKDLNKDIPKFKKKEIPSLQKKTDIESEPNRKIKFCKNCGYDKIDNESIYCEKCGHKIR